VGIPARLAAVVLFGREDERIDPATDPCSQIREGRGQRSAIADLTDHEKIQITVTRAATGSRQGAIHKDGEGPLRLQCLTERQIDEGFEVGRRVAEAVPVWRDLIPSCARCPDDEAVLLERPQGRLSHGIRDARRPCHVRKRERHFGVEHEDGVDGGDGGSQHRGLFTLFCRVLIYIIEHGERSSSRAVVPDSVRPIPADMMVEAERRLHEGALVPSRGLIKGPGCPERARSGRPVCQWPAVGSCS
jgi:hypothetical protein